MIIPCFQTRKSIVSAFNTFLRDKIMRRKNIGKLNWKKPEKKKTLKLCLHNPVSTSGRQRTYVKLYETKHRVIYANNKLEYCFAVRAYLSMNI